MKSILQRLVGARQEAAKKPTPTLGKPVQNPPRVPQEDWAMSPNDALRANTVSGYK